MNNKTVAEIIALALLDAGVKVATNVPGFGGTQVFEAFERLSGEPQIISYHEETAFTVAHGAALTGVRSCALMKTHGLAKALNSALDAPYAGTAGGFVTIVFDDKTGAHSDNYFQPDALLSAASAPLFRADSSEIYETIHRAFELSEEREIPVIILADADEALQAAPEIVRRTSGGEPKPFSFDPRKHFVSPFFGKYQYAILQAKLAGENWRDIPLPDYPDILTDLPRPYSDIVARYRPFFEIFREFRGDFVGGDTSASSLFSCPPFRCVDVVTYLGGSIPLAIGAYLGACKDVWATVGDFSFIGAAHYGLIEAITRRIPLKVVIFANGKAGATGGQPVNAEVLRVLLAGYEPFTRHIWNAEDSDEIRNVLGEAKRAGELRIIVVHAEEKLG